jgi:hypothetical protein
MKPLLLCLMMTAKDYAVQVSYNYAPDDKSALSWRAFLTALDKCHDEGYQDAYLAGQPAIDCDQSSPNGCVRFAARASYDCQGMGYQPN